MKRIKKVAVAFMIAFAVMLSFQVVAEDMTTTSVKAAVRARNKGTKYIIKGNKIRIYTIGARGKVRYYSSNNPVKASPLVTETGTASAMAFALEILLSPGPFSLDMYGSHHCLWERPNNEFCCIF